MLLLIIYVSIALLFSFLCSIAEAVLLSVTMAHISVLEQEGKVLVMGAIFDARVQATTPGR